MAAIQFAKGQQSGDESLLPQAIKNLRRALAIDSDDMAAYNLLATIFYLTAENDVSKLKLAELVCKQAKDANDKYAPIYNSLGLIKLKEKNVTGALEEFKKAVALDPKLAEAQMNIGSIGLSSRQYERAEEAFSAVLKLQPNNIDAIIGLGVAARGERKFDDAEKWYKKAAELDSKNCMTSYNLGLLYHDYKTDATNSNLKPAQQFYGQFIACAQKSSSKTEKAKIPEAQRRIKDIDETFAALEAAKKAEEEGKKQQEEYERQQKLEEQKQQQQAPKPTTENQPADGKGATPASDKKAAPAGGSKPATENKAPQKG